MEGISWRFPGNPFFVPPTWGRSFYRRPRYRNEVSPAKRTVRNARHDTDKSPMKPANDQERHILHGLACEWEAAVQALAPGLRRRLTPPLFRLSDMTSMLGRWKSEKREICLGRHFAFTSPWGDIREVLLHETAHQLAEALCAANTETPHGESFRHACELIGADPSASGNLRPLSRRIAGGDGLERSGIWSKIKKLMALSESGNEHEARAAMLKAHQLMARHNIDHIRFGNRRHYCSILVGEPALRHTRDTYLLAALITEFYFVQGIWISVYVVGKRKMGRALELSGTATNIQIAAYVYDYVKNHINASWNVYNTKQGLGKRRKTDFALGIIQGFRSSLASLKGKGSDVSSRQQALAVIEDPELSRYLRRRHPSTASFRKPAMTIDANVYGDGERIGRQIVVARGIAEKSGYVGKMIGQ